MPKAVLIALAFVVCAVALVAAQHPRHCAAPFEFEARAFTKDHKDKIVRRGHFAYDAHNERTSFWEELRNGTDDEVFHTIHLFREHRRTRFNLKTKVCTVEQLDARFHRIEIPREAQFQGEAIIGTNAFIDSGLTTTHWFHENKTEKWAWFGVYTDREVGCIPVADDFDSPQFGHVSSQYFDTVLGISDPNVFIPEDACRKEAGVYGPEETVAVQEQTAGPVDELLKGEYNYDVDYPQAESGWSLFKQCDPAWANARLGTCAQTICQAGCAMSSVAMILRTRGVNTNPGALNSWLEGSGGYASGCEIVWSAADRFGKTKFQGIENPSFATACSGINSGHGIIANVRGGSHWVLLTGCDGGSTFYVNDPGFDQSTYPASQALRMAVYH